MVYTYVLRYQFGLFFVYMIFAVVAMNSSFLHLTPSRIYFLVISKSFSLRDRIINMSN